MNEKTNQDLIGKEVHYVQGNGTHAKATIIEVGKDPQVVNLRIEDDGNPYERKTVVYRKEPVSYSWHWPEDDQEQPAQA